MTNAVERDGQDKTDTDKELEARFEQLRRLYFVDPAAGIRVADETIDLARAAGDLNAIARATHLRGVAKGAHGDIGAALVDIEAALNMAREIGNRPLEAQCLHAFGNAHYHRGEYAIALESLYHSLAIHREISNLRGVSLALSSLGGFLETLGNFEEAVVCLVESLALARQLGDETAEPLIHCNLGSLHLECTEYEAARDDLREAERLAKKVGDHILLPHILTGIVRVSRKLGDRGEVVRSAEEALAVTRELGNPGLEASALVDLAEVREEHGDVDDALRLANQAAKIAESPDSTYQAAPLLISIGSLYLRQLGPEAARSNLEKALEIASRLEQKQQTAEAHQVLSRLCETVGDSAGALAHYKAFHEIDAGLKKQSALNLMIAQRARLDVERARQEAEIHRLRNVELVEANRKNSHLLEELRRHADKLAREATEDPLTGLYNRRYLRVYLEGELESRARTGERLAVAIADLDNFKQINDRFSHIIGDTVLKTVASFFQLHTPLTGVAARYGGEEFVLVLPDYSHHSAALVCETVRAEIESYPWQDIHPDLRVTISIGVADETGIDVQALLARADKRLYQAKQRGKNRVV